MIAWYDLQVIGYGSSDLLDLKDMVFGEKWYWGRSGFFHFFNSRLLQGWLRCAVVSVELGDHLATSLLVFGSNSVEGN